MGSALRVAGVIHDALTIANMNAWHFWWIYSCSEASCGNGALWPQGQGNPDNVEPTKRLWVMGNFSRFARPGSWRIDATKNPEANVKITAYRDSLKTKIAVVILNSKNEEFKADFDFGNTKIGSFKPYITDDNSNLKEGSEVKVDGTKCSFSVPARSATTIEFVLWQEPKVEPPSDSTDAIAFGTHAAPQSLQSTYKVFSPLGAFIGEFQAGHIGDLRNAMTNAGLSRGVYMVKCSNAKMQRVVLK
jgi:glucuronoarabinoxylan endo-1,4-beta-xylanase